MTQPDRPILVVDDDDDIRQTLVDALDLGGYQAVGVPDGAAALDYLRSDEPRPAFILLDLMMPRMNGEAFRRLQLADPALADIPVVILSAHAEVATVASALEVAHHLGKPVKLDDLLDVAQRFAGP